MGIIARVGQALQQLFGECAEEAAQASDPIVQQKRKFTAAVAGAGPSSSASCASPTPPTRTWPGWPCRGAPPSRPRRSSSGTRPGWYAAFLEGLFRRGIQVVVGADQTLAPLPGRFTAVTLLDSSTFTPLPDNLREEFPGCGGGRGGGAAGMKLQTELDLRSGALHVEIEAARSPDGATSRQHAARPAGALRITDLGYFNVAVFAAMALAGVHFLSRLQFGTAVRRATGVSVDLLPWLERQAGPSVDQPILLGAGARLSCRLIAWRVPAEQAARRRQKLRQEVRRKRGCEPSAERLAWCDWTILVTSVPVALLTPAEAVVLYRARWQVELLFKRWKGQDLAATLSGSTDVRRMVRVWSRLLAALVQHWLLVASAWGQATKSLVKVCEAIRSFVGRLAAHLDQEAQLRQVVDDLCAVVAKTCRRDKRAKPGTFELLNDVSLLDSWRRPLTAWGARGRRHRSVERTSTKTTQPPCSATRSNSPCGRYNF